MFIFLDIAVDCLSLLSTDFNNLLLTLPLVIKVFCVDVKSFDWDCNVAICWLPYSILFCQTCISLATWSNLIFCCWKAFDK